MHKSVQIESLRLKAGAGASGGGSLEDHISWLRTFQERVGRPLRVLHVGNVANNAYLNAKFLRSVGVEAHVLCYDYYHVMGMPEWEEIELHHRHGDDVQPRFSRRDLRGYRRPAWFVNGPLINCAAQMDALWGVRLSGWLRVAQLIISRMTLFAVRTAGPVSARAFQLLVLDSRMFFYRLRGLLGVKLEHRKHFLLSRGRRSRLFAFLTERARTIAYTLAAYAPALRRLRGGRQDRAERERNAFRLVAAYDEAFPDRADRLKIEDVAPFQSVTHVFRDIFRHYDIVQCYATDPIHVLLAGKRPYIAFEHGTLRDFTMRDAPLHRLTALAYRQADHAFITNGDCLSYATQLGIERYSPIVHPIDVEQHRRDFGDAITKLRREIGGDVLLFCPLRHDWKVKGTDIHLRALPRIKERVTGRVKLVLIRWGMEVAESEALLESLGCGNDVVWRSSMCRITMIKHMRAADVVLDQMALPHFGATAPQAIAAGTPVISSYKAETTRWIIPEPAPILPAFSPEDVSEAVAQAIDPDWRADYRIHARLWTDRYHHPNNVIREHLAVYRRVLEHDRQDD